VTTPATKVKALCVATRCTNVDQFVTTFSRFCDEDSFFVATVNSRPVGLETAFSIQLVDGAPMLRGMCIVRETWSTPVNQFGRPGIRLGIVRLTRESTAVFRRLLTARRAATTPAVSEPAPAPGAVAAVVAEPPVAAEPAGATGAAVAAGPPPLIIPGSGPPEPISGPPSNILGLEMAAQPAVASIASATSEVATAAAGRSTFVRPPPVIPPLSAEPPVVAPATPVVPAKPMPPRTRATAFVTPAIPLKKVPSPKLAEPPAPVPVVAPAGPVAAVAHVEPAVAEPAVAEPAVAEPAVAEPVLAPPVVIAAPVAEPVQVEPVHVGKPLRPAPGIPSTIGAIDDVTAPTRTLPPEIRTPGSEYVLPANPLMNLTDESLEGFVDCTLHESTGAFPFDETTPLPSEPKRLAVMPPIEPPLASPSMLMSVQGPGSADPPASLGWVVEAPISTESGVIAPGLLPAPDVLAPALFPVAYAEPGLSHGPKDPADWPAPADVQAMPITMPRPRAPIPRRSIVIVTLCVAFLLAVIALVIHERPSRRSTSEAALVTQTPENSAGVLPATPLTEVSPTPAIAQEPPAAVAGGLPIVGKGPCRMTVLTTPAGATVQLDGAAIGPAPLSIDGPCERRRLNLTHPRYQPVTRWVTPSAGSPETVDVALTRPTHTVMVVTQPPGATVLIEGRLAGKSPTSVQIMGFQSISLTVEKNGYKSVTQRFYSTVPKDRVTIKLPLTPLFLPKRR